MALICGTTPLAWTLRWKMSAYPPRETTPSWMRAPPLSLRPMTGAPLSSASSMTRQIFSAWASASEPPSTVKSWLNTYTSRPFTVPYPVTTPSPRKCCLSNPNKVERCVTSMPISSKLPGSSSRSMRSRAVSLPLACWASMRFSPPPKRAWAFFASRRSRGVWLDSPMSRNYSATGKVRL